MWRIEFSSADFLPFLPEQAQSNPGVYGFELAAWLSRELARRGLVATYPLQEDWGWLLQYEADADGTVLIGCSSVCGEGDGYVGRPVTWSVFVDQERHKHAAATLERVQLLVVDALTASGISVEGVDA